jgi:hypothetical protein
MVHFSLLALWILFFSSLGFSGDDVIKLNPKKTYLVIYPGQSSFPLLELRESKGQVVALRLDEKGLFIGSKLECSWPDGRYQTDKGFNMVLGYSSSNFEPGKTVYKPCLPEGPIISTWGDCGNGTAALFVQVEKLLKDHAEVRFRGKKLILDLLPLKDNYRVQPPNPRVNECGC